MLPKRPKQPTTLFAPAADHITRLNAIVIELDQCISWCLPANFLLDALPGFTCGGNR